MITAQCVLAIEPLNETQMAAQVRYSNSGNPFKLVVRLTLTDDLNLEISKDSEDMFTGKSLHIDITSQEFKEAIIWNVEKVYRNLNYRIKLSPVIHSISGRILKVRLAKSLSSVEIVQHILSLGSLLILRDGEPKFPDGLYQYIE